MIKLILLQKIENLGIIGDIIKVRNGYARNYLIPYKFAIPCFGIYSKIFKNKINELINKKKSMEININNDIEKINNSTIELFYETGKSGKLFGSVKVNEIKKELEKKGIFVEKKMIILNKSIKYLGKYSIFIKKKSSTDHVKIDLIIQQKK